MSSPSATLLNPPPQDTGRTLPEGRVTARRSRAQAGTAAGGEGPVDPATLGRWRARLDALTRWCLSDAPLAPAAVAVAAPTRPTLGDLLRRALSRAGDGVVDLLDAFEAPAEPAQRARLARVLGGDVLLVVVTARDGAVERAEPRACRTPEEATALLGAFLGGAVAPWMATAGAHVRDAIAGPLLLAPIDGAPAPAVHAALTRLLGDASVESTLVLPFLSLDGRSPSPEATPTLPGAAAAAPPVVLGGVLRPGAAFLDAPAFGVPDADADADADVADASAVEDADDAEEVDAEEADDEEADDEATSAAVADAAALLVDPALAALVAVPAADADDETDDDTAGAPAVTAEDTNAVLERLRARRAPPDRVSVMVATDDGVAEHVGDAAAWLAGASEQELRALARAGWTGDAAVELALAADDPEVDDVARQARRHEAELVVEIDGDEAVRWLRRHRPALAERLEAVL